MDGLSLTHGAPGSRQHIWTFASGLYSVGSYNTVHRCPCDNGNTYSSPSYVGNEYFCESVTTGNNWNFPSFYHFFSNAILWDSQVCEGGVSCCQLNNPLWFTKTLSAPTTDGLELRLCLVNTGLNPNNVALELLELYIQ